MRRYVLLTVSLVAILSVSPLAQTSTWRPVVLSDTGMIASGHALASEAGIRVLKSGGNAIDAAVAAWAVQGLTEPEMTGLGGDMFMLIYLAKTGEVKFINGTGVAPMAATVDFYKGKGGLPDDGILSVSVPGAVAGAEFAAKTYGTKPLSELMAPAVELADKGFPITESLAGAIRNSSKQVLTVVEEDLVQRRQAARLRRSRGAEGSRQHAARDRRQRQRRVLPGTDCRKIRRLHEGAGRTDRSERSRGDQGERRSRDQDQLQGHRRLRVPAQLAGLRDAAGAQHPRRDERALHAPQQRAVPACGHRVAQARLRRSQQVRRGSEVHAEHPDGSRCCRRNTRRSAAR